MHSSVASAGERARALVALGAGQGVLMRVLGGVAIALRADSRTPRSLLRRSNDLDLAVPEGAGQRAGQVLLGSGLVALSERFNALHGHRRLVFRSPADPPEKVDIFVGDLEMCHTVPLRGRLEQDPLTLAPTDLLLSKGQIVRLTAKDRLDIYCLLWNHAVRADGATRGSAPGASAPRPAASDGAMVAGDTAAIDAAYVAALCARDWGWWRTLGANLAACLRLLPEAGLPTADQALIGDRLTVLEQALAATPKSLRWRARGRVGERVRWYEEPEEIEGAR
jgi:hypothetical protein